MKILVGVDGSPAALEAVRQAALLASPKKDRLVLYYAPPTFHVPAASSVDPHIASRARLALATAVFDDAQEALPDAWQGHVETIVGTQDPRHGLLVAADDAQADLLVVGARGLGPIQRLLLGSVSSSVVHSVRIPVLVARPRADGLANQPWRVLLAYDATEPSRHAADLLGQLTWPANTVGRVVNVMESMLAGNVPHWLEEKARTADEEAMAKAWVREHDAEKQQHRQELAALETRLPAAFQNREPLVAEGYPAEQILKTIAAESIDLVVMGARGLGIVGRVLMGSTSTKVLTHAPCSVMIVREKERP